ncbi:Lar family restriction alleviation protein, partial [Proteus terrae]|uniref:Lar family restriction alleviation protein n=1 Tax=Proteus terrae TaxID=1574161 RepID=UPI003D7DB2A4
MGDFSCPQYQICENRITGAVVMNELKKCPFCGCERIFVGMYDYEEFDDKTYYKAECNSCEAETGFKDSKQEAIA